MTALRPFFILQVYHIPALCIGQYQLVAPSGGKSFEGKTSKMINFFCFTPFARPVRVDCQ
jgi:hypothetical protein